jgi:hypothetical protein
MKNQTGFPWKTVLIIIAVFTVLCCCLAASIGGFVYYLSQSGEGLPDNLNFNFNLDGKPVEETAPDTQPTIAYPEAAEPTKVTSQPGAQEATTGESPTEAPAIVEPAETSSELTGKQEKSDYRIFDDFSSNALGWYQKEEDSYAVKLENETYTLQSTEKDYMAWAEFPVEFIPYEIAFDVKGPAGKQDGTFGVECQYLDDDNLYYIEFDLGTNEYTISEKKDGESIPLTKENSSGQFWHKASALKSPPTSANHIGISCYLDTITVFVNGKLVDQVNIKDPLPETGIGTFYVYAYDFADENGYKVIFDNVEISRSGQ